MRAVITTVQPPVLPVRRLVAQLPTRSVIVIGDAKGPFAYLPDTDFLPLSAQSALPFELAGLLPTSHYSRKNLGYLRAMRSGSHIIYETDDDNFPVEKWQIPSLEQSAIEIRGEPWVNIYHWYRSGDAPIWPRGLPLTAIRDIGTASRAEILAPRYIQQCLVNKAPDVDAVWRLIYSNDYYFSEASPLSLAPGSYCPFNSQNTWWFKEAFALMYLPSFCSFRMTDIWRGFIAQRCLSAAGTNVLFRPADAIQERNEHVLARDFEGEVDCYLGNGRFLEVIRSLELNTSMNLEALLSNLRICYVALIDAGFCSARELDLVDAWTLDVRATIGPARE